MLEPGDTPSMTMSPKKRRRVIHRYASGLETSLHFEEIKHYGFVKATKRSFRRVAVDTDASQTFGLDAALRYRKRLQELGASVPAPPNEIADEFAEQDLATSEPGSSQSKPVSRREASAHRNDQGTTPPAATTSRHNRSGLHRDSITWLLVAGGALLLTTILAGRQGWAGAWLTTAILLVTLSSLLAINASRSRRRKRREQLRAFSIRSLVVAGLMGLALLMPWAQDPIGSSNAIEADSPSSAGLQEPATASQSTLPPTSIPRDEPMARPDPVQPQIEEYEAVDQPRDPDYLRFIPAEGAVIQAVRFGEDDWTVLQGEGFVHLPTGRSREWLLDGRAIHSFEALVEYATGQRVVMRGDILRGLATTIVLDHPAASTAVVEDNAGTVFLRAQLNARSQTSARTQLQASVNSATALALPAVFEFREGLNTVEVLHPTPGSIDETRVTIRVDDGNLLADPKVLVDATLHRKQALTVLNLTEQAVQVQGRWINSTLIQTLVPRDELVEVSSPEGDVFWTGALRYDAVLLIADPSQIVQDASTQMTRRSAERAAEESCEGSLADAFNAFGVSGITYPTGFFGGKTGVSASFDANRATVTRTAPVHLTIAAREIAAREHAAGAAREHVAEYECQYDATSDSTTTVLISSEDLMPAVRGIWPEVATAPTGDEAVVVHGQARTGALTTPQDLERRILTAGTEALASEVLLPPNTTGDDLRPISLVPVGPDAARIHVRDITLVIPVVEFATTRFTSSDPEAHITVATDDDETYSGTGVLDVRAPIGTEIIASAESGPGSRYLPSELIIRQTGVDQTIPLHQGRKVIIQFDANVPEATLRIPGVEDTPAPMPVTVELIEGSDYEVFVVPPDERWFDSESIMQFTEDTSVTLQLVAAAEVTFTSDPSGATIFVQGQPSARTPVTFRLPVGSTTEYRIHGNPPHYKRYEGQITVSGDAEHPTYLERYTEAERRALEVPSPVRPAVTPEQPTTSPSHERAFDSSTGRPSPPPGHRITATPQYVVAFLANELELRDITCPPAPVSVIICGLSADGEAMISTLLDTLFEIYLQPATREVRWYRDGPSGAYVGAFRRPEGVYVISIAGTVVSIGYAGP